MAVANTPKAAGAPASRQSESARRSRLLVLVPVAAFVGLMVAFGLSLKHDPNSLPSALMGKPVPEFTLPPVKGTHARPVNGRSLGGDGCHWSNVFASWCVACREEHPLLMRMKAQGLVPIHGLNYKDRPDDAARWLDAMGDPYTRTGADLDGRVAIDGASTACPRPT